jgi:2-oxo-3-hexenedioate decarboxylase
MDVDAIAADLLALHRTGRQIGLLSAEHPDLDVAGAYRIGARLRAHREARGERWVGRKIGFTNHRMWEIYDVKGPIWGPMYSSTVRTLDEIGGVLSIAGFPEPRMEPEIVFGLGATPTPGMDEAALLGCIEWMALGFELVSSVYANWSGKAADMTAAYGLHAALVVDQRVPVNSGPALIEALASFRVALHRNGMLSSEGGGKDVLGSPLTALRHLNEIAAGPDAGPPLAAGEIITTGTLTLAMACAPGESWSVAATGIGLSPLTLRLS